MASGRQDYQEGVVPVKSRYSYWQIPNYFSYDVTIAAGSTYTWAPLTVDEGYILNVFSIRVYVNEPYRDEAQFMVNDSIKLWYIFSGELYDNFPYENPIQLIAGETVNLKVFNHDSINKKFIMNMLTYLEQIQ